MALATNYLTRVATVETDSLKIENNLTANQDALNNAILKALGGSGSAESRKARAASAMPSLLLLIAIEEGCQSVCKSVRDQLSNVWNTASRTQTTIEIELKYLVPKQLNEEITQIKLH